jgi:hypothetical protein
MDALVAVTAENTAQYAAGRGLECWLRETEVAAWRDNRCDSISLFREDEKLRR